MAATATTHLYVSQRVLGQIDAVQSAALYTTTDQLDEESTVSSSAHSSIFLPPPVSLLDNALRITAIARFSENDEDGLDCVSHTTHVFSSDV